jgi:glycosyltransferase involved in cell wall biosynthesis
MSLDRPAVLVVLGAYFPELSGGGLQARELILALRDRLRFTVLTTSSIDDAASRVDDVDVFRIRVDLDSGRSILRALGRGVRMILSLRRSFDVMHLEGYTRKNIPLTIAAALLRKPIVLTLHTGVHDDVTRIKARSRLGYWAISRAKRIVGVSPALRDAAVRAGIPAQRVQYLPNGVDLDRFRPADAAERAAIRRRLGIPADTIAILFVGFFSAEKGPQRLFAAWRALPAPLRAASTLVFVGQTTLPHIEVDPAIVEDIRRQAAGIGARPVFVERTHEIEDYYRAADLFVLASTREGCPVALLEAMACGLPVISTRLPGATDMIVDEGRNGRLVAPGSEDALRAALERMLADMDAARAMGARARETADATFSLERTARAYLDIYRAATA